MNYIKSILKPGDTAFDIGAHKGGYLNLMRKCVGPGGLVVGFEPQVNLYNYLTSFSRLKRWSNVTVEHLALSDTEGKATLHIPVNKVKQDSSPGATLLNSIPEKNIKRTEAVKIQTLDHYIGRHQLKPVFLKIDVEGNELNVLKGGQELLHSIKPKILIEIEARHVGEEKAKETFDFLENMNYSGRFIHHKRLIPLTEFSFDQFQNLQKMDSYCNNFVFE